LINAANLKTRTTKDLAVMAKRQGISGWSAMKKDELVKALAKQAVAKQAAKPTPGKSASKKVASKTSGKSAVVSKGAAAKSNGAKSVAPKSASPKSTSAKAAPSKPAASKSAVAKAAASKSGASKAAAARPAKSASAVKPAAAAKSSARPAPVAARSAPSAKLVDVRATARKIADNKEKPAARAAEPKAPPAPAPEPVRKTSPRVIRKIQEAHQIRGRRRDLASESRAPGTKIGKDRCALLVRDPYWLQAYWEISRETVERAKVALAAHWHTAQPVLRLSEIDDASTTSAAERVVREIPVHGGVCNWYIDVVDPPKTYRVALGYRTGNGKFHALARSNKVSTPPPGAADLVDGNWSDIAENCEKIFALSGGYQPDNSDYQLRELFEERLRRPMGSPAVTQYGAGADLGLGRMRDFAFSVDAEMIVFGQTDATAYVTLGGEPVKLRPDGSFVVRLPLPDRRQVLPIVASSADGVEQRTTVLAVERNTKVMEPLIRENGDE